MPHERGGVPDGGTIIPPMIDAALSMTTDAAGEVPRARLEHLYLFGGVAIGFMLGLLVAAAAWSSMRGARRRAEQDERERRRLARRKVGQDEWAEAADRVETPSADDLERDYGDTDAKGGGR
jgi:hypothetical protein